MFFSDDPLPIKPLIFFGTIMPKKGNIDAAGYCIANREKLGSK